MINPSLGRTTQILDRRLLNEFFRSYISSPAHYDAVLKALKSGDRYSISKTTTLLESTLESHREMGDEILSRLFTQF